MLLLLSTATVAQHNYGDALHKSILFFEGQRSGRLPPDQRVRWRRDSALNDGATAGVDLTGGYYDAGDNVKFGFPMAFTTTLMSWGLIDFGKNFGSHGGEARAAVRWATDYLMKATATPNTVYVQVGDAFRDHSCWERPEDMDTPRTVYKVDPQHPGSDVAAETAAALAAGSNEVALGASDSINEFGWDNKHAGINILISKEVLMGKDSFFKSFQVNADNFICTLLPGISNHPQIEYSPGGLLFKVGNSNMQHVTSLSFLLLAYANYASHANVRVPCGGSSASPVVLRRVAKRQVDYILGDNPLRMSYMVGYGERFPRRIHHRGSSLPSVSAHPNTSDNFPDARAVFQQSEPTTYINAPLLGLLAYFSAHPNLPQSDGTD
ncbi:unnamed protein product [Triticum turgidum subsp. durum]|uniref:Endoglucanase n=1 Tax=Triticum turgidum subsp. durum TaxID=4567 RepID=A0A9R0ZVN8_TRITD|nr:unnamed protein product [Triticum turgidum subsp. durum]